MANQRKIDKLVEILKKETSKYNEKQIKSAILAEGYSEDTAKAVLEKLFPKSEAKKSPEKKVEHVPHRQETKKPEKRKENPKEELKGKIDYYKEVNYLLSKLKEINTVKKPEIKTPNILGEYKGATKEEKNISNSEINSQIEMKKQELAKIKIEPGDDLKIIDKDGKIIDLNNYPRRDWRKYRDLGKTIAETKEEKMQKLRSEIYDLKRRAGKSKEVEIEEQLSKRIAERVKQRSHTRFSEKRLDLASKNEAEKLREKYKNKEIEKKDFETAVENIYTQMKKNPGVYKEDESENKKESNTETKKENKTETKESEKDNKKQENNEADISLESDTNLDNNDLSKEFDLGLNLNPKE